MNKQVIQIIAGAWDSGPPINQCPWAYCPSFASCLDSPSLHMNIHELLLMYTAAEGPAMTPALYQV